MITIHKKEMFLCCSKKRCYGESWIEFYDYGKYTISRSYDPQPTLKDAIGDLENDRTEVQMLLDFVQGSFQKKWS